MSVYFRDIRIIDSYITYLWPMVIVYTCNMFCFSFSTIKCDFPKLRLVIDAGQIKSKKVSLIN